MLPRGEAGAEVLAVDVRDVDMREGTMPVNVVDVTEDTAWIELPSERPRRRLTSVPRALVLDCPEKGAPPPAPVDVEGDRGGINPGDPIPVTPRSTVPGDDNRRTSSKPPPPVETLDAEQLPDESEDEKTHVFEGKVPVPRGEEKTLISGLPPEEEDRLNKLAAERGLSPDEMAKRLAHTGIETEEQRKDREGPKSPKP